MCQGSLTHRDTKRRDRVLGSDERKKLIKASQELVSRDGNDYRTA